MLFQSAGHPIVIVRVHALYFVYENIQEGKIDDEVCCLPQVLDCRPGILRLILYDIRRRRYTILPPSILVSASTSKEQGFAQNLMFGRKVGVYKRLLKGQGSNQARLPGAKHWGQNCVRAERDPWMRKIMSLRFLLISRLRVL